MTAPGPVEALYRRLERGWQLISQERDLIRRRRLEDHWLRLLQQYERACDETEANPHAPRRAA